MLYLSFTYKSFVQVGGETEISLSIQQKSFAPIRPFRQPQDFSDYSCSEVHVIENQKDIFLMTKSHARGNSYENQNFLPRLPEPRLVEQVRSTTFVCTRSRVGGAKVKTREHQRKL